MSDARLGVQIDTDGARRLNYSSPNCLKSSYPRGWSAPRWRARRSRWAGGRCSLAGASMRSRWRLLGAADEKSRTHLHSLVDSRSRNGNPRDHPSHVRPPASQLTHSARLFSFRPSAGSTPSIGVGGREVNAATSEDSRRPAAPHSSEARPSTALAGDGWESAASPAFRRSARRLLVEYFAVAPSSLQDSVYEKAASFGRDVFQYIVTGTMFAIVCSVPWWSSIPWEEVRGSSQLTVLFVVATVLFALGHVLLAIGFWIRNKLIEPNESWWDRSWNCVLLRFAHCRDQVEQYNCATERARQALPSTLVVGSESTANVHVGLEMSVLLKQPGLHAVFIERYNTLWHLRLGLAASFLVAGVVNLVFAICSLDVATCWRDQRSAIVTGLVGLVSLLLGRLPHVNI